LHSGKVNKNAEFFTLNMPYLTDPFGAIFRAAMPEADYKGVQWMLCAHAAPQSTTLAGLAIQ